jgi:uncharacterized protein (TIRG00374 family)
MKKLIRFIIILVITVFLIWFFLRGQDLRETWTHIKNANYYLILFAFGVTILGFFIRAYRWKFFLMPVKETRSANLFSATCVGFAANSVIGGRVGEVIRAYLLAKKEQIGFGVSFASIIVERIFDMMTIFVFLSLYLIFFPLPESYLVQGYDVMGLLKTGGIIIFAFSVLLTLFLLLLHAKTAPTLKFLEKVFGLILPEKFLEKLLSVFQSFADGLAVLKDRKNVTMAVIYSFILWSVLVFSFWVGLKACHIDLAWHRAIFLIVFGAVGATVPTPAAVGGFHAMIRIALSMFGVSPEQAGSAAIIIHVIAFIPVVFAGIIFIWKEGFSLFALKEMGKKDAGLQGETP